MRQFAAHMSTRNQRLRISCRPKRRNGGTARADGARAGQGARSDHELVFRVIARGFGIDFFPKDLVTDGGAADVVLKAGERGFNLDFLSRQIDAETFSRVAANFFRHSKKPFL